MNAWLPTATCTPKDCAKHRGPAAGVLTGCARLVRGVSLLAAGVACAPLVALLGPACRDRATRRWARALVRGFGLRVRIDGAEQAHMRPPAPGAGVLVVSNHISWLDVALIGAVLPGRMLAKSEIRHWPLLGWVAAIGGTLFVERERLRELPTAVRTVATALSEGSRVVVFPEACTWCGTDHGRFTSAVFQAALDAGVEVRPVRIAYTAVDGRASGAAAFVGDDTLLASLWRVVSAGGLTARITVLPLLSEDAYTDRRSLALAAAQAVAGCAQDRPAAVHEPRRPRRLAVSRLPLYGRSPRLRRRARSRDLVA
jgi:1-acyl-sn-glycerol-3-phosphate acyltransferase